RGPGARVHTACPGQGLKAARSSRKVFHTPSGPPAVRQSPSEVEDGTLGELEPAGVAEGLVVLLRTQYVHRDRAVFHRAHAVLRRNLLDRPCFLDHRAGVLRPWMGATGRVTVQTDLPVLARVRVTHREHVLAVGAVRGRGCGQ